MRTIFIIFAIILSGLPAFSDEIDGRILMGCEVTPQIDPDYIPLKDVKRSNNLIRLAGSPTLAKGMYINIKGRVTDENCTPIQNAFVRIWQTDSDGNYEGHYTKKSQWDVIDESYDKNFAYSGTAQTDNLGNFNFVTILPVIKDKNKAPHINFRVKHDDFEELQTMMFFNEHPKNIRDRSYLSVPRQKRDLIKASGSNINPGDITHGRTYEFNITLEGLNKYRRY